MSPLTYLLIGYLALFVIAYNAIGLLGISVTEHLNNIEKHFGDLSERLF